MLGSIDDLISVLREYNPWWSNSELPDLPTWKRAAFRELKNAISNPPAGRAVLLSGARQTGKTTLFWQVIQELVASGTAPGNILYVTFDHPLLKLLGIERVIGYWREIEPVVEGPQYLFVDEIQYTKDWQTWLKHQVDFKKHTRIAVTGSAVPLSEEGQESGVGRWHTIRLAPLSFYEFLQIRKLPQPPIPRLQSLTALFKVKRQEMLKYADDARQLPIFFFEYLMRGGFPQCAQVESIYQAQRLLREDIVDKVLKRDMTAMFGVRRVLELEQVFLYLCLHDGGQLDLGALCSNLQIKKPTARNFLDLLEATHLINGLRPFGYGKEVLRGKQKIYLADPAIASSVLLKGKGLLEDDVRLGSAVETAIFRHIYSRYYHEAVAFSYWRGKRGLEIDVIAEIRNERVPFEVKFYGRDVNLSDLEGLVSFCAERDVRRAYVATRSMRDIGLLPRVASAPELQILKLPASLMCYWLGQSELGSDFE